MIVNFADFVPTPRTDVIVVGAGAVGIMVATDLASRGIDVVLLEAGLENIDSRSQDYFNAAKSVGRPHTGLYQGRFRALGGTTNFWGGQLVRFEPLIFEKRAWIEGSGWPINIEDLEPFYRKCETVLKIPPELLDDRVVCRSSGVPDQRDGEDLSYFFTRWLTEKNFRFRFRNEMQKQARLTVVTGAAVTALSSSEPGIIDGVIIKGRDKELQLQACVVLLANGTVEMARLLLHPLANGAAAPWADNAWLGRGFMDHLEGELGSLTPRESKMFFRLFDNLLIKSMKMQPRLRPNRAAQIRGELLSFALHVRFEARNGDHFENAKIFFGGLLRGRFSGSVRDIPANLLSAAHVGVPMIWNYLVNRRISSPKGSRISLRVMLENEQTQKSQIRLLDECDALGMKIVQLDWALKANKEIQTIRNAAHLAKKYFDAIGVAELALREDLNAPDDTVLDTFVDTFHHMGAVRMANTADDGVVDSNCRVFGTENLFVAGAAIFPSAGFANPTLTAMALALRTADRIYDLLEGGGHVERV